MKRILVTGAAGFLGGRTAKYLAQHLNEYHVIGTSRRSIRMEELAKYSVEFIPGDLCDAAFCNMITQNINIVIHCAALSAPFGSYTSFYESNVLATKSLLQASINNKVKRFIFISTPSIYFNFSDRYNVRESDPLPKIMVNNYAKTKLLAENVVLSAHGTGIQTISLRPRAIIGAEDTVIFPRMLEAHHKDKLKIIGDGMNICDMTCVRNVIEAIMCAINASDDAYGEAYNITDNEAVKFWDALQYTLSEMSLTPITDRIPKQIAMIAAGFFEWKAMLLREKKEPILTRYSVGILANHFTLDISKAMTKLHYRPVMSTYEGINEYITWHKRQP